MLTFSDETNTVEMRTNKHALSSSPFENGDVKYTLGQQQWVNKYCRFVSFCHCCWNGQLIFPILEALPKRQGEMQQLYLRVFGFPFVCFTPFSDNVRLKKRAETPWEARGWDSRYATLTVNYSKAVPETKKSSQLREQSWDILAGEFSKWRTLRNGLLSCQPCRGLDVP